MRISQLWNRIWEGSILQIWRAIISLSYLGYSLRYSRRYESASYPRMPSLNPSPRNPFLQLFFQQKLRQFMVIRENKPTYISSSGLKPILTLSRKECFYKSESRTGLWVMDSTQRVACCSLYRMPNWLRNAKELGTGFLFGLLVCTIQEFFCTQFCFERHSEVRMESYVDQPPLAYAH